MSTFARSGKTPRKRIEKDSICTDQFVNKNELDSIINERINDVYKYIEDNNSKLNKNVQQTKEQLKEQKTEIENLTKKPVEVPRKAKPKIAPLILPEGFNRKSIHQLTESAQQKVNTDEPRPLILMDKLNRVEASS